MNGELYPNSKFYATLLSSKVFVYKGVFMEVNNNNKDQEMNKDEGDRENPYNKQPAWSYDELLNAKNRLKELSTSPISNEVMDEIRDVLDGLNWTGAAADIYRTDADRILREIENNNNFTVRGGKTLTPDGEAVKFLAGYLEEIIRIMKNADRAIIPEIRAILEPNLQ